MNTPSFVAPKGTSTPRKTLPPDSYPARCYQMIMLGTQEEEFEGKKKSVPKIWLGWEFPTELDTFGDSDEMQPYTMGKEYSFYVTDKANLRKDLDNWRGEKLSNDEADNFDVGRLIGAPCQIGVVSYTKRDGTAGVKIGTISRLMKGVTCPLLINAVQAFSIYEPDFDLLSKLPQFLQDRIKKSPEYQAAIKPHPEPTFQPKDATEAVFGRETEEEPLPF